MKNIIKTTIVFLSLIIFLILTYFISTNDSLYIDTYFYNKISLLINDFNTIIAKTITFFGSAQGVFVGLLLLIIFIKNKKLKILIIANIGLITLINQTIKFIIKRPRPEVNQIVSELGYSYPSGHTMLSLAFYGLLIYIIYRKVKSKKLKVFLITSISILIILIGLSRIYLGVHYLTDVLAGLFLSISYIILFISWSKIICEGIYEK